MTKYNLGSQPTAIIVDCQTLDGSPFDAGAITKDEFGRLLFTASAGAQLPFKENFEILRLVPLNAKDILVKVPVDGTPANDVTVLTVPAAEPFVGSFVAGGSETVKFSVATGEGKFLMLVRAYNKGQF